MKTNPVARYPVRLACGAVRAAWVLLMALCTLPPLPALVVGPMAWAGLAGPAGAQTGNSPVTAHHLQAINAALARNGIGAGRAEFDAYGRVTLAGEYADEREVDRAFSLAQVEVGIRWVSLVTPERIRVKEWERRLGGLFARSSVIQPPTRGDAAPGPIRSRHALVVGVGRFRHGIQGLEFAARDAQSYYEFLVDPRRGRFPRENVTLLLDESATRSAILQALDRLRSTAGEDDLVTVYMSSHGSPPDKRGAVNIVTHDTEAQPRERIWHTSITEEAMKDFVERIRAKRLVMVLDTCYSNGAYRAVPGFLPPGGKSLGVGTDNDGWGIGRDYGHRVLGAKDLLLDERGPARATAPKSVGTAAVEPWGKVLIGASGAGEQSWESDRLHNSIFTYYFVDGLNRHQGSVQQAFNYAKPRVTSHVKQEKGSDIDQNPQAMATVPTWDMSLARDAQR